MADLPKLDPRRHPYRSDLAAESLRGKVRAPRFVRGKPHQVCVPLAPLRRAPDPAAMLDSELLFGETFTVYDAVAGWAWGQANTDGYVGYLPLACLSETLWTPTHRVASLGAYVYVEPDIKSPPLHRLSLNALLHVLDETEKFFHVAPEGYIPTSHLTPLAHRAEDFVSEAERFLGVPYLWGGRSSLGLDCSALIQLSLQATGRAAPRDSDMQQAELGAPVDTDLQNPKGLKRGDLVFWSGHVGVMADATTLLHANAYHMETAREPLVEAQLRIQSHGPILAIRRLFNE